MTHLKRSIFYLQQACRAENNPPELLNALDILSEYKTKCK